MANSGKGELKYQNYLDPASIDINEKFNGTPFAGNF